MSTYVLMRVLESSPRRYELGMRVLTLGRIDRAYDRVADQVAPGQHVVDIGCGTGALTRRIAERGAVVKGIDVDPAMLEIARDRLTGPAEAGKVELVEAGVAELDAEPAASRDAVVSGLCFSELSTDELNYTLVQVARILRPGGRLVVADEVRPGRWWQRVLHSIVRVPLVVVTYLITQQTTHALRDLPARLATAGFHVESVTTSALGSFGVVVATTPGDRSDGDA